MMVTASSICGSVMHSGGARRMMWSCVAHTSLRSAEDRLQLAPDDGHSLVDLRLCDAQRRCQADDVVVCWLGKEAGLLQCIAQVTCSLATFARLNDNSVEQ